MVASRLVDRHIVLLVEEIYRIAIIIAAAVIGFSISGVAGFGGGVVVLPILVWAFGPREAVPVIAISQAMGTASRAWIHHREIDWQVVRWFAVGSLPLAALGSFFFVSADMSLLTRIMGAGIIAMVVFTLLPWSRRVRMALWGFLPVGGAAGFLSAFVGIPGPFPPVFYLAYGMAPAAYIGTFSLGMLLVQAPKLAVMGSNGVLTTRVVVLGLVLGVIALAGSYAGHWALRRIPDRVFVALLNVLLVAFGILFLVVG